MPGNGKAIAARLPGPYSAAHMKNLAYRLLAVALLGLSLSAAAAPPVEGAEAAVAHESLASRASGGMQHLLDSALGLVGIRYRRGGSSAESGFDCSGFVGYVFLEQLGLKLPRTS